MTQQVQAGSVDPVVQTRSAALAARRGVLSTGARARTVVTATLVLLLFAGDLVVALQLPVRASTCTDRLCGPALGVAPAAAALGALAIVLWLVGDRRGQRGRGAWLCWVSLVVAALPWAFVGLRLQWW